MLQQKKKKQTFKQKLLMFCCGIAKHVCVLFLLVLILKFVMVGCLYMFVKGHYDYILSIIEYFFKTDCLRPAVI